MNRADVMNFCGQALVIIIALHWIDDSEGLVFTILGSAFTINVNAPGDTSNPATVSVDGSTPTSTATVNAGDTITIYDSTNPKIHKLPPPHGCTTRLYSLYFSPNNPPTSVNLVTSVTSGKITNFVGKNAIENG
jgi:hypothetical protein